jgi:hypothetical protein
MEMVFLSVDDGSTGFISVIYIGELRHYLDYYRREKYHVAGQFARLKDAEIALRKNLKTSILP